jgi:hypothetical protein
MLYHYIIVHIYGNHEFISNVVLLEVFNFLLLEFFKILPILDNEVDNAFDELQIHAYYY